MKKIFLFVTIFLSISSMRFASAAAVMPVISEPGGQATWYYIQFNRPWKTNQNTKFSCLYDLGAGKPLIAVPAFSQTADGILWKVERTTTADVYRIVSKRGNTLEYTATAIEGVAADRFYSSATSSATYTIASQSSGNFFAILHTSAFGSYNYRGLNKTNNDHEVTIYTTGGNDGGCFLTFVVPSSSGVTSTDSLTSTATSLAFGNVTIGLPSNTKTAQLLGYGLTDNVTYSLSGTNAGQFTVTPASPLAPTSDGVLYEKIGAYCAAPTTTGALSASIALTSTGSFPDVNISLSATGENTVLPVTLSSEDTSNETWYYIYNNRRMGFVMSDVGDGAKIEARPLPVATTPDPGQLWKVVSTGISGRYKLINKLGRGIAYNSTNKFTATATVTNAQTFNFLNSDVTPPVSGSWVLFSNEANDQVNKDGSGAYTYGTYGYSTDKGNSVQFILPEDISATAALRMPYISDNENTYWYSITFESNSKVLQDKGVNEKTALATKPAQLAQLETTMLWKITGTWGSYKIKAYSGLEAGFAEKATDGVRMKSLPSGDGDTFGLSAYTETSTYQIHHFIPFSNQNYGNGSGAKFLNRRSDEVGFYGHDQGGRVTFTLVPTSSVTVTADANINNASITAPAGVSVGSAFDLPNGASVTVIYQVESGYKPIVKVNGEESGDVGAFDNGTYTLTVPNITAATTIAITADLADSLFGVVTDDSNAPIRYYNLQGIEVSTPVKGNVYIVKQGTKVTKQLVK